MIKRILSSILFILATIIIANMYFEKLPDVFTFIQFKSAFDTQAKTFACSIVLLVCIISGYVIWTIDD